MVCINTRIVCFIYFIFSFIRKTFSQCNIFKESIMLYSSDSFDVADDRREIMSSEEDNNGDNFISDEQYRDY